MIHFIVLGNNVIMIKVFVRFLMEYLIVVSLIAYSTKRDVDFVILLLFIVADIFSVVRNTSCVNPGKSETR